jgi:hypothetical protein
MERSMSPKPDCLIKMLGLPCIKCDKNPSDIAYLMLADTLYLNDPRFRLLCWTNPLAAYVYLSIHYSK